MKIFIYTIVGFLLGIIISYALFVLVVDFFSGLMHEIYSGRMFLFFGPLCGLLVAFKGYKLAKLNYQFKNWQKVLIALILVSGGIYSIWFLYMLKELGKVLQNF